MSKVFIQPLTVIGVALGVALLYAALLVARPLIESELGLFIAIGMLSSHELALIAAVMVAGLVIGVVPGYRAYRYSLADGMTIRL